MTTGYIRGFAASSSDKPRSSTPGKYIAKGHDAQLQQAMYSKSPVTLHLLGMGSPYSITGTIVRRDKFTITLAHLGGDFSGMEEIFYKHAIASVLIEKHPETV